MIIILFILFVKCPATGPVTHRPPARAPAPSLIAAPSPWPPAPLLIAAPGSVTQFKNYMYIII